MEHAATQPEVTQENEMGTVPMGRLLAKLAIPMILSTLISSLYSLVDSIFVARLGANPLTAISLAAPVASINIKKGLAITGGHVKRATHEIDQWLRQAGII